jgi:hypothetical protein
MKAKAILAELVALGAADEDAAYRLVLQAFDDLCGKEWAHPRMSSYRAGVRVERRVFDFREHATLFD